MLMDLTKGYGADIVLECSGAEAATCLGLQVIRKGGKFTQIGLHSKSFEMDFRQILLKDLVVKGSFASSLGSWERSSVLLSQGKIQIGPIVSDILPLSDWENGFNKVNNHEGLKILLEPEH